MRRFAGAVPFLVLVLVVPVTGPPVHAQADTTGPRPRPGGDFAIPLASVLVPGIGQYTSGHARAGLAYSATFAAGIALVATGDPLDDLAIPRTWDGQRTFIGAQMVLTAGALSAYQTIHDAIPGFQRNGRYRFVTNHDSPAALLTAPFDPRFLSRWTTWVNLAYTGLIATILGIVETEPGAVYEPFRPRDAFFVAGLSYNAGVAEEAMFRGWLYPWLRQSTGSTWGANAIQAAGFGALHFPQAEGFAVVIGGWALYQGWLTERNGWSIRESVFHHFWYDVVIAAATLLTDERATIRIGLPPLRF